MHQQVGRSKSDEPSHLKKMKEQNGSGNQARKRSQSLLDKAIKGHDSFEFQIPTLTPPGTPPSEARTRAKTLIGEIDLSLYNNNKFREENFNESDEEETPNKTETGKSEIGKLTCQILYDTNNHTMNIEIIDIDVKVIPSSFVKGSNWVIKPLFKIEIRKHNQSPNVARKTSTAIRKTSVFQSIHKSEQQHCFTTIGNACKLPFKHKTPSNFYIRVTVLDVSWNHPDLAIGYVHLPISEYYEIERNVNQEIVLQTEWDPNENETHYHGEFRTELQWNPQENIITLHVSSAHHVKKSGSGKEYYIKITTFIGNLEYSEHKSEHVPGDIDIITLHECTHIYLEPPNKIENVAIVIQLFVKQRIGHENVGQSVIGPYTKKSIENNNLSVWEQMIISPYKNITYTAPIHT